MTSTGADSLGDVQQEVRQDDFRRVVGGFCSGVTVVTGMHEGRPAGLTCQSFFSLSLDPPLIAFSPSRQSASYPTIRQAGRFAVNILSTQQQHLAVQFARSGTDKWAGVDWSPGPRDCPLIAGTVGSIVCDIEDEHEAGDHFIVIGRVRHLIHNQRLRPLLYFNSRFASLSDDT